MDKSTAAISLGLFVFSFLVYQRLTTEDNDDFPTVPRPKGVPNPIRSALAEGYMTVVLYMFLQRDG